MGHAKISVLSIDICANVTEYAEIFPSIIGDIEWKKAIQNNRIPEEYSAFSSLTRNLTEAVLNENSVSKKKKQSNVFGKLLININVNYK